MQRFGVEVLCDVRINRITKEGKSFRCFCADDRKYRADRVILAAGGRSSPNLGSNGSGYKIAEGLGHTIHEPFPALVPVRLKAPYLKRLSGVRVRGRVDSRLDDQILGSERGELLFTDYGISGIPVLQISRTVSEFGKSSKKISLHIDLFPDSSRHELIELIERRIGHNPDKSLEMCFVGLLHKRLIGVILRVAGFDNIHSPCGGLTRQEIYRIADKMKNWRLQCSGVQSWMYSQVTAGGVCVDEVDSRTMESGIVPGLFFAGEVLDIDGDCGGYNLQWAWSSGFVAGMHAAK
jgi:predicted Rossmann fold flavoprotein